MFAAHIQSITRREFFSCENFIATKPLRDTNFLTGLAVRISLKKLTA